jgi:hypothetical protein
MCQLEAAGPRGDGTGERAFDVSEQLRLGERFRNRRGVERDESLAGTRAVVMNRARNQLFAGSRFRR